MILFKSKGSIKCKKKLQGQRQFDFRVNKDVGWYLSADLGKIIQLYTILNIAYIIPNFIDVSKYIYITTQLVQ